MTMIVPNLPSTLGSTVAEAPSAANAYFISVSTHSEPSGETTHWDSKVKLGALQLDWRIRVRDSGVVPGLPF